MQDADITDKVNAAPGTGQSMTNLETRLVLQQFLENIYWCSMQGTALAVVDVPGVLETRSLFSIDRP